MSESIGLEARRGADLDTAPPQLVRSELGQGRRSLAHYALLGLHQDPAGALEATARVAVDHVGHVVLKLGDPLHSRVARAHEDEGEAAAALLGVVA